MGQQTRLPSMAEDGALKEGETLLAKRQRLIKIADRSSNGWSVVAEYAADELAEDSEDEKRLEKAEKAAERKAGLKRMKKQQPQRWARAPRFFLRQPGFGGFTLTVVIPGPQQQSISDQSGRRPSGTAGLVQRTSVGPLFCLWRDGRPQVILALPMGADLGEKVVAILFRTVVGVQVNVNESVF